MGTETHSQRTGGRIGIGELGGRGGLALVAAVVANLLLVALADAAGVAPNFDPLSFGPVALFTALGVAGATLVYGLVSRFAANPGRVFTVVAAVVLLLSLVPDAAVAPTFPGATTVGVVVLAVTHVTTAVACVAALTGRVAV